MEIISRKKFSETLPNSLLILLNANFGCKSQVFCKAMSSLMLVDLMNCNFQPFCFWKVGVICLGTADTVQ